jgi:hypothetical protein
MIDRRSLFDEDDNLFEEEDDESAGGSARDSRLFLGMTPVERMFISIFLFMNVTVLGLALLLATGRIGG